MLNSIKLRLVIFYLLAFSAVFVSVEVYLYHKLEQVVISLVDEHLNITSQSLGNLMTIEDSHGQSLEKELEELSATASGAYAVELSGHYYQIVNEEGKIVSQSPSLLLAGEQLPPSLPTYEARYETISGPNGETLRMVSKTFVYSIGTLTFQVADDVDGTYVLVNSFRNIILFVFPAFFVLSGVGIYILSGWALKSLRKFSDKIGQVSDKNLSERITEEPLLDELKPLASSFNMMMGRLEGSFARQKQFLSDASHELRTPTSIIKSFCDVTLGRERSADDYREALKKIGETVNRMVDIINRILVISRLDMRAIQPVRIDLHEVLKDVARILELPAANRKVKISVAGSHVNIRGDREGVTEVFSNIVENAIKYNKPEGAISINVGEFEGTAVVTVEDTGIGIPDKDIDKIFDRFFRVDASRSVTVGSGLGLSIVKAIIEAHGGEIGVRSELGRGTTFTVRLPLNHDFSKSAR